MAIRIRSFFFVFLILFVAPPTACQRILEAWANSQTEEVTIYSTTVDVTNLTWDKSRVNIANYSKWCEALPDPEWHSTQAFTLEFKEEEAVIVTVTTVDDTAAIVLLPEDLIDSMRETFGTYVLQYGDMLSLFAVEEGISFDLLNCGNIIHFSWGKG